MSELGRDVVGALIIRKGRIDLHVCALNCRTEI
jgi:hypothetical protein